MLYLSTLLSWSYSFYCHSSSHQEGSPPDSAPPATFATDFNISGYSPDGATGVLTRLPHSTCWVADCSHQWLVTYFPGSHGLSARLWLWHDSV